MSSNKTIFQLLDDKFILFDTEYTAWEGSMQRGWSLDWEYLEIIQIGAIQVQRVEYSFIEHSSFLIEVRPVKNPQLSDYITSLTGITQETIDQFGHSYFDALKEFLAFSNNGELPIHSWGGDEMILEHNCQINNLSMPDSSYRFSDIRDVFTELNHDVLNISSCDASKKFGMDISGHDHNALHDVRSILAALNAIASPDMTNN